MSKAPADLAAPAQTTSQPVTSPTDIINYPRMDYSTAPSSGPSRDIIGLVVNIAVIIVVLQVLLWKLQQHYINGVEDKYILITGKCNGTRFLAFLDGFIYSVGLQH